MKIDFTAVMAPRKLQIPQSVKIQPRDFKEVLEGKKEISKDIFKDIQEIQKAIIDGKEFSGRDLILYQIKTSQYGMRVELISKIAEAAVSTVRKFQNQQ